MAPVSARRRPGGIGNLREAASENSYFMAVPVCAYSIVCVTHFLRGSATNREQQHGGFHR
jgi:hypothetical protein